MDRGFTACSWSSLYLVTGSQRRILHRIAAWNAADLGVRIPNVFVPPPRPLLLLPVNDVFHDQAIAGLQVQSGLPDLKDGLAQGFRLNGVQFNLLDTETFYRSLPELLDRGVTGHHRRTGWEHASLCRVHVIDRLKITVCDHISAEVSVVCRIACSTSAFTCIVLPPVSPSVTALLLGVRANPDRLGQVQKRVRH